MELSETIEIKNNSFTFLGGGINFIIYNENHKKIVDETMVLYKELML
ncbi:MAG: hypothetical protein RSE50_12250 [Myroides sp.]